VVQSSTNSSALTGGFGASMTRFFWGPWSPWDPVDACAGVAFEQTRFRRDLLGMFPPQFEFRQAIGSIPPNWSFGEWWPPESDVCSGVNFTQERVVTDLNGCESNYTESRDAVGTRDCTECEYEEYWPSPEQVCAGKSFVQQAELFSGPSTCEPILYRDAVGTRVPVWEEWSEWSPSESEYCSGDVFQQTRERREDIPDDVALDYLCDPQYEERDAVGTKDCPCLYEDWLPPTHEVCVGDTFDQTAQLSEGPSSCASELTRSAIGTGEPSWVCGEWEPSEDTVCEGQTFTQLRVCYDDNGLCDPEKAGLERQAVGTKDCAGCTYSEWSPDPSEVCEGTEFTQERYVLSGPLETCNDVTRSSVGTKDCTTCVFSEWYPDPASYCEGQEFEQYRDLISGDYTTCPDAEYYRTATGTDTTCATFSWCEGGSTSNEACTATLVNTNTFTNPLSDFALMVIDGSVDDDVVIDGSVYDPSCCIFNCGLNGAHGFIYTAVVGPGQTTTVGYNDNHGGSSGICITVSYTAL